jgi:hypothetical protein
VGLYPSRQAAARADGCIQALAFACIAKACAAPLPIWKAAPALLLVRAGTAIPDAPANVALPLHRASQAQFSRACGLCSVLPGSTQRH